MQSAKQEVQEMLLNLPDDCTFEDIQYHLYVLEKVRKGVDRLDLEGGISQEQAEQRMSRWITKGTSEQLSDAQALRQTR